MCRRLTGILSAFLVLFIFILPGCSSTKPMALRTKTKTLDLSESAIVLVTTKIANELVPSFQPSTCFVTMKNLQTKKTQAYTVGKPYNSVKNQFKDYLISMECVPGEHELQFISGTSMQILFCGSYKIPINKSLNIQPDKILYLGRIEAINRKKVSDDEVRAGPVIPLIDQSVSGFSSGTWHTKIFDNYEEDIAAFKKEYPALSDYTVEKVIITE